MKPIWIIADEGDLFEGHQGHWAECFFYNATQEAIEDYLKSNCRSYEIREMTEEELKQYPEVIEFIEQLEKEYS